MLDRFRSYDTCGDGSIDDEGKRLNVQEPSNTGTSGGCGQKSDAPKTAEYRFEGTSPEGRFRARVNDIDVGTSRVNRIDVSGFAGLVCGQD